MNGIKIYEYNGCPVSFDKGENTMVNATEMAKPFGHGKEASFWLNTAYAKDYLNALAKTRNLDLADLVRVTKGGNNPGTWMHSDVALEFARWLSPAFAIWTNDRIKELLTTGVATVMNDDEAILKAINILQFRLETAKKRNAELAQEKELLEGQNESLTRENRSLAPKAEYTDKVLQAAGCYVMNEMAKELGFGGAPTLQRKLQDMKIIFRQNGMFVLYSRYCGKGYEKYRTHYYEKPDGTMGSESRLVWTEAGRAFLHKAFGIVGKGAEPVGQQATLF